MEWLDLRFLVGRPTGGQLLLDCSHALGLVLLAYVVACVASYATLSIADRLAYASHARVRRAWRWAGALFLGGGVWAMHFIAMLAFRAPIDIQYDLPTTLLSLLIVCVAALLAMRSMEQLRPTLRQCVQAALCIGAGIVLMHYSGMAAIRSSATLYYDPWLFALSVVIAVVASFVALWLALRWRDLNERHHQWLKGLASLLMGGAIVSMHFTGMWAMSLVVPLGTPLSLPNDNDATQLGVAIGIISVFAIGCGLGAAAADRKLQSKESDLSRVNRLLSDLDRARALLQQAAQYDALTNLLNRRAFTELFGEWLHSHAATGRALAVMFLDVDHFKRVNDSLGHDAGDHLLHEVAARIRGTLREQDVIARFGGDEFCILISLHTPDEARQLAERILQRMKEPILINGRSMVMSASIGISLYPEDGDSCEELLKHADLALYQAKSCGRNALQFFNHYLKHKVTLELQLEEELRQALTCDGGGGLLLHYQPILDLRSGDVTKLEALLRWQHPRLGLLGPDRFLGIAEANGFITELDAWVLRRACVDLAGLVEQGHVELRVAVNCSALDLSHDDLPSIVAAALEGAGLRPQHLELEVTENALMSSVNQALGLLQRIRELGVSISIDDFGTGYSSLAYLKRLPLDTLKIDRSFLFDIPGSEADGEIVHAIIGMAHILRLQVVAEGVESAEQLAFLRGLGCDFIQGYLFSRPLPLELLGSFLVGQGASAQALAVG
ncbi:EAL domain-containing protein [Pseudomonas sp. LS44]|uniref:putative bifunctional diguanylate cyclase/phosphodiesterase n=1 Tax=Pseudomonas sp. LS44 TaxID=1357074 RepID=UPI00215B4318|nr:bifunctional diguanylate cyclase/phosphodiesterase [Pseudomonas sp. LS44]UVE18381.1 EAL domain-containing protein [Pseudomonas sp. LS44]